jgi:hypothetical protein
MTKAHVVASGLQWKIDLIEKTNPDWNELFVGLGW